MLFSGQFFGNVFSLWNIGLPAYILCVLLGLLHEKPYYKPFLRQQSIILSFLILLLFFSFAFLIGPMHAYSQQKLLYIAVIGSVSLFAWFICIQSTCIELDKLSLYLLLISLGFIGIAYDFYGFSRPTSFFDFNFFRDSYSTIKRTMEESMGFTYQTVGVHAMLSVAFIICKTKIELFKRPLLLLSFLLSVGVILIAQARQAIFGFIILLFIRNFIDKRSKITTKIFKSLFLAALGAVLLFSIKSDALEKSLHATDSTEFFNRDYEDIDKSISNRSLFLGTGLGGYSLTGERAYPHNVVLELYYETGSLGLIFISCLLLFPLIGRNRSVNIITQSSFYILIPITSFFIKAIISSDLTENIALITALIIIINIKKTHTNHSYLYETHLSRK